MNSVAIGIIPARYASSRLPGKPLAMIRGKSMIQRVYEQAKKSESLSDVWVATDNYRIVDAVNAFGGKVVMTSESCLSGTDRCAEAFRNLSLNTEIVVNIQGDEPFVQPEQIDQIVGLMKKTNADIGTLGSRIQNPEAIFNPNVVKLTKSSQGKALYFSRNPIPYVRGEDTSLWFEKAIFFRHLGMYSYRSALLPEIAGLSQSPLELAENLEQLRWLEAGYSIYIAETPFESIGIDTPEDLEWVEKNWESLQP